MEVQERVIKSGISSKQATIVKEKEKIKYERALFELKKTEGKHTVPTELMGKKIFDFTNTEPFTGAKDWARGKGLLGGGTRKRRHKFRFGGAGTRKNKTAEINKYQSEQFFS